MKNAGGIRIATRYVSAIFEVAQSASAVASVERELQALAHAATTERDFADFLNNPLLGGTQQATIMAHLADQRSMHRITKAFLVTLAEAKRLNLLTEIARQFAQKAEADRGELSAELVTAHAATAAEISLAQERLSAIYQKKVILTARQDTALLGGAVIHIGSMQLDASLAGKLQQFEHRLKAA